MALKLIPADEAGTSEIQTLLTGLNREVRDLREAIVREAADTMTSWLPAIEDRSFTWSAENLALYLALRQRDLGDLQDRLAVLGLSSLGRSESHVLATLDAVSTALAMMMGGPGSAPEGRGGDFHKGDVRLAEQQQILFGGVESSRPRILVTLPTEAATSQDYVATLLDAGMDCARINCSHDDAAAWRAMADNVRTAARARDRTCRILMDVGGPKCRIATVHGTVEKVRVHRGDRFAFVSHLAAARPSDAIIVTVSLPQVLEELRVDHEVWIDDGRIGTRVVEIGGGRVVVEAFAARAKGERLKPEKGLNFPKTELHLSPLTPEDRRGLDVVAEIADMVGFSFVQRTSDIAELERALAKRRPGLPLQPLVLKIETPLAVRHLPQLIVRARAKRPIAVMIARGDLAVELGFERLSEVQEEILWLCEAAQVPVIWATQVLEDLISDGLPSRAEATDAAMSQRADCIMLNKGEFLKEGIVFLADVLQRMARHQHKKSARFKPLKSWQDVGGL